MISWQNLYEGHMNVGDDSQAGVVEALLSNGDLEVELVDNGGVVVGQFDRLAATPDLLVTLGSLLKLLHTCAHLACHLQVHI
jgi:hypothetical protein